MVYHQLFIVKGVVVTVEELRTFLLKHDEEAKDLEVYDLISLYEESDIKFQGQSIDIFPFPCCSENNNKLFIIEVKVHTYYRKHVKCYQCDENSVCDYCIGETNNGQYDVQAILDGPVSIVPSTVCDSCGADNKGPFKKCNVCYRNYKESTMYLKFPTDISVLVDGKDVGYYVVIDDCLSCT